MFILIMIGVFMNKAKCDCHCQDQKDLRLIFSCSGASDVGHITDLAARKLTQIQVGNMYCLAGIGGGVSGILKTTEAANSIVTIDGCSLNCAKKTLERAGFKDFKHIELSQMGMLKGSTEPTEDNIQKVVQKVQDILCQN